MNRFEIDKYEKRPKSYESAIDERYLVASLMMDKEIYTIVEDMQMMPWAWSDSLSREVYEEFKLFVDQKGHERAMSSSLGSDNRSYVNAVRYFMEHEDAMSYINMMRMIDEVNDMGKYGMMKLIQGHIQDRRRAEAKQSVQTLLRRIEMSEPFADEVDELQKFIPNRGGKDFFSLAEIADMMDDVEEEAACFTGFRYLDSKVVIREGGCFIVVGGESSSGKTTWTNQVAWHISKMNIGRGLFFSTETDPIRLGRRMHKHIACIEDCELDEAREMMRNAHNLFVTNKITHVDEMIAYIRKEHKSSEGVRFVYADYLQNLSYKQTGNVVHDLEQVVKKLHHLAQELKIVLILLAQPVKEDTRLSQHKDKPKPTLSSFRGCAALGNAADIAIFLQCPDWKRPEVGNIKTQFHVIKNKEGPQCVIEAELVKECYTFLEL